MRIESFRRACVTLMSVSLVSLGLQVRTHNKLKVRQPLRAAHVILSKPALEKDLAGVMSTPARGNGRRAGCHRRPPRRAL
jgi:hypothetical protein